MRKVNNICISEEKAVLHYVDLIGKFFEENSEITLDEGRGLMSIKDVQEWGVFKPKLDVCG